MASSAGLLDLTLSDFEGRNLNRTNFSSLYITCIKNDQTYTHVFIEKVLGPHTCHMWSV